MTSIATLFHTATSRPRLRSPVIEHLIVQFLLCELSTGPISLFDALHLRLEMTAILFLFLYFFDLDLLQYRRQLALSLVMMTLSKRGLFVRRLTG